MTQMQKDETRIQVVRLRQDNLVTHRPYEATLTYETKWDEQVQEFRTFLRWTHYEELPN